MSLKLSIVGNLSKSGRQTVPQTRSCNSKTSVTKSGAGPWNSEWSV